MKNIENIKAFEKEEDKNEKKNLINIGSEGQKFDDSQQFLYNSSNTFNSAKR